jgi:hypothetical protein
MKLTFFAAAIVAIAVAAGTAHAGMRVPPPPVTSIEFGPETPTVRWTFPEGADVDGFRLTYTTIGRKTNVVTYETDADARSFDIPPDAPRFLCRTSSTISIVAFNDAGESEPVSIDLPRACLPNDPAPMIHIMMPDYAVSGPDASIYSITWDPLPGAASFLFEGTLTIVRESVLGQCAEPRAHDMREIPVNAEIAAAAMRFDLSLPPLPPEDRWAVLPIQTFATTALDAYGEPIAGEGRMIVRESCGFGQPQVALPDAGSGTSRDLHLAWLVFALVTTGLGCASAQLGRLRLPK